MITSKPPPADAELTEEARSSSAPVPKDQVPKVIFTVFPRDATPKQIADALNELRRRQSGKQSEQ